MSMRDVGSYSAPRPLTGGARLLRGFKRVGIALAIVTGLIGVPSSIFWAISEYDSAEKLNAQMSCMMRVPSGKFAFLTYDTTQLDFQKSGCPGPRYADTWAYVQETYRNPLKPHNKAVESLFFGIGITSIIGGGLFLAFWLLGWVFAGFSRDSQ